MNSKCYKHGGIQRISASKGGPESASWGAYLGPLLGPSRAHILGNTRSRTFKWPGALREGLKIGPQNRPLEGLFRPPFGPIYWEIHALVRSNGPGPSRALLRIGVKIGLWEAYFRASPGAGPEGIWGI